MPPHEKSWLIGKDSDAGRDWGQEEKGMTKDEMAGWHHGLDGCESEWTLGDGDEQGGLACCDSWGRKVSDTTEWLNWTETSLKDSLWKANGGLKIKKVPQTKSRSTLSSFYLSDYSSYPLSGLPIHSEETIKQLPLETGPPETGFLQVRSQTEGHN